MITLKEMRRAANLKAPEVAEALGVSARLIYMWENGERALTATDLQRLVVLYDAPDTLLTDIDIPLPDRNRFSHKAAATP